MRYYYVDINKETIKKLYDIVQTTNIQGFIAEKIRQLDKKVQKDNRIVVIGLPLKNQSTKDVLTILEENNLDFEINEHHN